MRSFIICLIACTQLSFAEDVTLVATYQSGSYGIPAVSSDSQTITLNQGDTASLLYANGYCVFEYSINSKIYNLEHSPSAPSTNSSGFPNPFTIVGPATIKMISNTNGDRVATVRITRAGIASQPASIPQEAGTTWDVILESSSDLVNWTLANPGEYSGTEPKRFFRTRIVKKP